MQLWNFGNWNCQVIWIKKTDLAALSTVLSRAGPAVATTPTVQCNTGRFVCRGNNQSHMWVWHVFRFALLRTECAAFYYLSLFLLITFYFNLLVFIFSKKCIKRRQDTGDYAGLQGKFTIMSISAMTTSPPLTFIH